MSPLLVAMALISVSFVAGVAHGWWLWAKWIGHQAPVLEVEHESETADPPFRRVPRGDADTGRSSRSTGVRLGGRHAVYGAVTAEEHRRLAGRVRSVRPGADAASTNGRNVLR